MNINEAFFCPGKLHASICGLATPPSFCTVSVCRIQDPVLVHLRLFIHFLKILAEQIF